MKRNFKLFLVILFIIPCSTITIGQDINKAKQSVRTFMENNYKNYKAGSFGEFFEQTYPDEIQKEIGTTEKVKYSLVHTYTIGNQIIEKEYFHLDKNLKVIGHLSYAKMGEITMKLIFNSGKVRKILDSLKVDTTRKVTYPIKH